MESRWIVNLNCDYIRVRSACFENELERNSTTSIIIKSSLRGCMRHCKFFIKYGGAWRSNMSNCELFVNQLSIYLALEREKSDSAQETEVLMFTNITNIDNIILSYQTRRANNHLELV